MRWVATGTETSYEPRASTSRARYVAGITEASLQPNRRRGEVAGLVPSGSHPFGYSHVADTGSCTDFRQRHANLVSLESEKDPTLIRLTDSCFQETQLGGEFGRTDLIRDDLQWLANTSTGRGFIHARVPITEFSVGTAVALPEGKWNDPTRHSLGSVLDSLVFEGATRDLPVTQMTVNGDRCWLCSKSIVLMCRSHAPWPSTDLYFASFTRKNREQASSLPARNAPQHLTAGRPRGWTNLSARGDKAFILPSRRSATKQPSAYS